MSTLRQWGRCSRGGQRGKERRERGGQLRPVRYGRSEERTWAHSSERVAMGGRCDQGLEREGRVRRFVAREAAERRRTTAEVELVGCRGRGCLRSSSVSVATSAHAEWLALRAASGREAGDGEGRSPEGVEC